MRDRNPETCQDEPKILPIVQAAPAPGRLTLKPFDADANEQVLAVSVGDRLPVRPPHLSRSRVLLGMRLDGVSAKPAVGDAAQDRDGRGQGPAFVVSKVFDVG